MRNQRSLISPLWLRPFAFLLLLQLLGLRLFVPAALAQQPSEPLPATPIEARAVTAAPSAAAGRQIVLPVIFGARPTLTVVGWNVESGGADPNVIAARMESFDGVDLWGLTEVGSEADANLYIAAAGRDEGSTFAGAMGDSGQNDRLLLIYDTARFALMGADELVAPAGLADARAPLVARLNDKQSGAEFYFVVNHFLAGDDDARWWQARHLNQWAASQTLPLVAVGDYNLGWEIPGGEANHDPGYDYLVANGVWRWVRPATLVTTQCLGWPCARNVVVDFVFAAGDAQTWPAASSIVVAPNDFPETAATSDHRPVRATFTLP